VKKSEKKLENCLTDWKVIDIKSISGWRQFELTWDKIAVRKRENCGFGAGFLTFQPKPANFKARKRIRVGAPLPAGLGALLACLLRALLGLGWVQCSGAPFIAPRLWRR